MTAQRNRRGGSARAAFPIGRRGGATQFELNSDRPVDRLPARTPITPAIRLLTTGSEPFEIDGDLYYVEKVYASGRGRQADVLLLRGHEYMRCAERRTRRAIQVRDLEQLIDQDRVDIPFGPSAKQYNRSCGWTRGGRTLASLGILIGGA